MLGRDEGSHVEGSSDGGAATPHDASAPDRPAIAGQGSQTGEGGDKTLRTERYYGAVSRSFQLPQDIDQAAAKAKCENGVLQLTLPKKQASGAQRLTIE